MMTDPIADMLTRLRNAARDEMPSVSMPHSAAKERLANVLKEEGFVRAVNVDRSKQFPILQIALQYGKNGDCAIAHIERVSKPGRRIYRDVKGLRPVRRGLGSAIVSTSQGLMPDRECRKRNIGGEVVCILW